MKHIRKFNESKEFIAKEIDQDRYYDLYLDRSVHFDNTKEILDIEDIFRLVLGTETNCKETGLRGELTFFYDDGEGGEDTIIEDQGVRVSKISDEYYLVNDYDTDFNISHSRYWLADGIEGLKKVRDLIFKGVDL